MTTLVIDLTDQVSDAVEALAARDGLTASAWLRGQVEAAFVTGRIALDPEKPRRPSRSARRRHAARARAVRAAAKASQIDGGLA